MPSAPRRRFVVQEKGGGFQARANGSFRDGSTIQLRGDVEILAGSAHITADEADLREGKQVEVRGNVRLSMRPSRWRKLLGLRS
jgi:lipopolysaccharide assembly outer membrane protein LptD (OstA)